MYVHTHIHFLHSGFLVVDQTTGDPIFLVFFRTLFTAMVLPEGFVSIRARNNRKFLQGFQRKLGYWQRRFVFVKVPGDYPLRAHWAIPLAGMSDEPDSKMKLSVV